MYYIGNQLDYTRPVELRRASRFTALLVVANILVILLGVGFVLVIDNVIDKIIISLILIVMPITAIIIFNKQSSKVQFIIDNFAIKNYCKFSKHKQILWGDIGEIQLKRAFPMLYSARPARFNFYDRDMKFIFEIPIGLWEMPAKDLAKLIEHHIDKTANQIQTNWTSDSLPLIK